MTSKFLIIASLILLGTQCVVAQETTVTFSPSLDTYVASEFPTTDNSTLDRTYSYYYGYSYRIFIDFDLSTIPDNAIVTSATLKMYCPWVNNAASHPYYLQRASSDWGGASKTWNNQPTVVTSDQLTITHTQTSSIGWHNFDVSNHAQYMINYPSLNYGWCMRLQSESGTTRGNKYWSQEYANSALRPILEVKYVMPIEISAKVKHCINSQNDGGIHSIDVTGGSSNYSSYEWFSITNGVFTSIETGTNINNADVANLSPGLYLLDVQDDLGYSGYQYFLVGEEGETTTVQIYATDLTKSQKYNEDAMTDDYPTYVNTNYGTYDNFYTFTNYYSAYQHYRKIRSLVKYKLDFSDFLLDYTSASYKTTCRSTGHYRGSSTVSNESFVSRVTSDWEEQIVTANSHPTITTTNQVNIPETNPTGYVFRDDNIDILNFVQYWQSNPSENYGFELALNSFTEVPWVRLIYGSSDVSTLSERPIFELSFDVKPSVTASWDETEELGSITVNAPNGELPYTYLIGYGPMPSMNDMWQAMKDSIPVDSTDFFEGDTLKQSFTFTDMPQGHYHVGVYDNSGQLIMDEEAVLGIDVIAYESVNVTESSTDLSVTSPASYGFTTLLGLVPDSDDGGFEFEVTDLSGDYVVGFTYERDTIIDTLSVPDSLFKFGIRINAGTSTYDFIKGNNTLVTGSVSIGDKFKLYKEVKSRNVYLYKNETSVGSSSFITGESDYKVEVSLKNPLSLVQKPDFLGGLSKPKPIITTVNHGECPSIEGEVDLDFPSIYFKFQTISWTIYEIPSMTIAAQGTGPVNISLPIGQYKIVYTYDQMINGNWVSNYGGLEYFAVGNAIQWMNFSNMQQIQNTLNTITPIDVGVANAESYNQSDPVIINWVQFEWSGPYPNPLPPYVVYLNNYVEVALKEESSSNHICRVRVFNPGYGIISGYVMVYSGNNTYISNSFMAYNSKPVLMEFDPTGGPISSFTVKHDGTSFNGTNSPAISGTVKVFAEENGKVSVDNTVANFCGDLVFNYADVTKKLDGGYYLAKKGLVKFIYQEEYNDQDQNLTYQVFDNQNQEVISSTSLPKIVNYGDNRYSLDFSCSGVNTLSNGVYVLKVINEKNEAWYLRIKIVDNC